MTHHISRYYPPPPNHSDHDDISDTLAIFLRGLVDGEGDRPRLVRRTVIRSDTVIRTRLIGFEQKVEMRYKMLVDASPMCPLLQEEPCGNVTCTGNVVCRQEQTNLACASSAICVW